MAQLQARPRRIAIVGYRGAQSLDITGPFEVFAMANRFGGVMAYEPILASPHGGEIVCNSGLSLANSVAFTDLPPNLDTILVVGGDEDGLLGMRQAGMLE